MGIYDYNHGVRIPAGVGNRPTAWSKARFACDYTRLYVVGNDDVNEVFLYSLPVPEKAVIRQFVMVGNVNAKKKKASISAILAETKWNKPRAHILHVKMEMTSDTPYELPNEKQKKIVSPVLPASGPNALIIDRENCYAIQARFEATELTNDDELELVYFEVYWD
jgi:hypothetical protein